jgi:nucleotide-binding universal stress UspA family protein
MIKTILTPATGFDSELTAFKTALGIARGFDSHLQFLHVGVDPTEVLASAMASIDAGGGGSVAGDWVEQLEAEAEDQAQKARRSVEEFCKREAIPLDAKGDGAGISASWQREKGREAHWIPAYAREADLAVIERAGEGGALTAALFDSGRPILIPGPAPTGKVPETAVIAWKPTREAARAVNAATPILEKCKRVTVITVAEEGRDDARSTERLVVALRRHNVEANARALRPGNAEPIDVLLNAAKDLSADLLVMGGYGHSRVREMIFGGFTERVLGGAGLPVLIAH